jgi:hypothetical protein
MFTIHGGSSQEVVLTPWMSNRRQPHFHLVIYCVADFLHFSNIQPFNNDNAPLNENVYKSMHMDPKFSMAIHLTDVYTSKKKEKNMWKEHSWKIFCNMIWLYGNMLKKPGYIFDPVSKFRKILFLVFKIAKNYTR